MPPVSANSPPQPYLFFVNVSGPTQRVLYLCISLSLANDGRCSSPYFWSFMPCHGSGSTSEPRTQWKSASLSQPTDLRKNSRTEPDRLGGTRLLANFNVSSSPPLMSASALSRSRISSLI